MIEQDEAEAIDSVTATANTMMVASMAPLVLFVGFGGRLLPTWMFLNSMQLIVHAPLLPVELPANVQYFMSSYLHYIRLNSD